MREVAGSDLKLSIRSLRSCAVISTWMLSGLRQMCFTAFCRRKYMSLPFNMSYPPTLTPTLDLFDQSSISLLAGPYIISSQRASAAWHLLPCTTALSRCFALVGATSTRRPRCQSWNLPLRPSVPGLQSTASLRLHPVESRSHGTPQRR